MPRNTSISLGDHLTQFVDTQVASGRYGSASVTWLRAGLRLLETQETELRALQEALKAGEASGEPVTFDSQAFLTRMRTKHAG
ncbi:antitoxin [Burkholderia ubonensis]|uniref:type II toxin-antitoxin system ParD family antitoxin n=1 Tax=Burkholderia ubonensis TaxID=101571 RepID=UPI0007549D0D|nr:type II toxin-antitoxin system ParD family antitoxin [Burkholderia ubonensis]KVZ78752.1 antitoxin [Burkholderia ubonensis]